MKKNNRPRLRLQRETLLALARFTVRADGGADIPFSHNTLPMQCCDTYTNPPINASGECVRPTDNCDPTRHQN